MVLNAYYILLWIRISKQIIAYLYFFVNEGTRRKTYRAGTQYKMYFIDNVIFSLRFFVEYGQTKSAHIGLRKRKLNDNSIYGQRGSRRRFDFVHNFLFEEKER